MNRETVRTEVSRYLAASSAVDMIEGVQGVVEGELRALDPSATVTRTQRFNHSFVPDFVMSWSDSGPVSERQVFLRYDLTAVELADDVARLPEGSMFVGLQDGDSLEEERSFEKYREEAETESDTSLLTDTSALAEFVEQDDAPLTDVLRSNVARGAKGLLDYSAAQEITDTVATDWGDTAESRQEYLQLLTAVDRHFSPDAAIRLRRTAQVLWMGLTGDLSPLDGDDGLALGQLSDVELRSLVPYLLENHDSESSFGLWRHIGTMFTLDRLFSISDSLADIDVTPLIANNTDRFVAKRARSYPETGTLNEQGELGWRVGLKKLALNTEHGRVDFASDGRRIRPESGSPLPSWSQVSERLPAATMTAVSLQGVAREWSVRTKDGESVRSNCELLHENAEETLFVPSLDIEVLSSGEGGAVRIHLDFENDVIDSGQGADLGTLAGVALGYEAAAAGAEAPDLSEWTYVTH